MTPMVSAATYGNPFLLWMNLALKTGETMWASYQVVTLRTQRMLLAHPYYQARDQREIALMGQEKVQAAYASANAMSAHMVRSSLELGTFAFRQWLAAATSLTAFASHRQSLGQQAKLFSEAATRSAGAVSKLSSATAQLAHHGLRPIHARATGNARRLAKR